jgi:hypothetical protein
MSNRPPLDGVTSARQAPQNTQIESIAPVSDRATLLRIAGYANAAANHINNARQMLLGVADPTADFSGDRVDRRLEAAVNLLNESVPALIALAGGNVDVGEWPQLPPLPISNTEALERIVDGEKPTIAEAAPDGLHCLVCDQLLASHPVEFSRDGKRLICITSRERKLALVDRGQR